LGKAFDFLPPRLRAWRYREIADAALLKGKHTKDDQVRTECIRLATAWYALALELEANLRHRTQLEASQARLCKTAKEAKPDQLL
jgi:hypothetical protein